MKAILLIGSLLAAKAITAQSLPQVDLSQPKSGYDQKLSFILPEDAAIAKVQKVRFYRHRQGGMPNAMAIQPLLTEKTGSTGTGFDTYLLQQDKMTCLVPNSTASFNMPVAGQMKPVAKKEAPAVLFIH